MSTKFHRSGAAAVPDPSGQIAAMTGPLGTERDLRALADQVGYHRLVGIGSAAEGTHESHRWRTELSRRLIEDHRFSWIGVDCDWQDCRQINQWLCGHDYQDRNAADLLTTLDRWPATMWANDEMAEFLTWLHRRNRSRRSVERVGLYGLDRYSLWRSLRKISEWLAVNAPDRPPITLQGSLCCLPYRQDAHHTVESLRLVPYACETDVVDTLVGVRQHSVADNGDEYAMVSEAMLASGAAHYYRTLLHGGRQSWNAREHHLADSVEWLVRRGGPGARGIVWAHNTHLGDARGTDMAGNGVTSLGQLLRERHLGEVTLVGSAAQQGTVLATSVWGSAEAVTPLPAAAEDSHEGLLHRTLDGPAVLIFGDDRSGPWLSGWRGQRAVGTVYRAEYDMGNYVKTWMGGRYDALIWLEETTALTPARNKADPPIRLRASHG